MLPLLLLCLAIALTAVILYFAVRFVTGEQPFEASYALRLVLTAAVVVVVAPFFQAVTPGFLGPLGTILAFVIVLYVVRAVLVEPITSSEEWEKAIWVSLLAVVVIYLLSAFVLHLTGESILPLPF